MKKSNKNYTSTCQFFKQVSALKLSLLLSLSLGLLPSLQAEEQRFSLEALNPYSKIQARRPSNFIPSDDVQPAPFFENKIWVERAFAADNEGVLNSLKGNVRQWQDTEEYAKYWNLQTTGLYNTPDREVRQKMLEKTMLKYADKRLTGEMKDAEEGTPMASVNKAQKALRPQADVGLSQNVKFKFRAKALQGEGKIRVENPWFDYETRYKVFENNLATSASKNFKTIGFKASADYSVTDKNWATNFDQKITEEVTARVSSVQSNSEMAFSSDSDRVLQLLYSKGW